MKSSSLVRSHVWVVRLLAVLLFVSAPYSVSQAQDGADYDDAIKRAVLEFGQGNWEEAEALFRAAHELEPSARTWRGLGVCAFELRRYVDATAALEAALIDPRKPLTLEQREHAQKLVEQARAFVSVYHVRVKPKGAEVIVDGKPTQLNGDELHLDPGPHTIVARASGYEERRAELRAGAGVQEELSIELSVVDQASAHEYDGASRSPKKKTASSSRRRLVTWSLAGATVASAVAATALRLRVNGLVSDHAACLDQGATNCAAVQEHGEKLLNTSYGMAGAAGALLIGASLSFFLEGRKDTQSRSTTFLLGPDGVQLRVAL